MQSCLKHCIKVITFKLWTVVVLVGPRPFTLVSVSLTKGKVHTILDVDWCPREVIDTLCPREVIDTFPAITKAAHCHFIRHCNFSEICQAYTLLSFSSVCYFMSVSIGQDLLSIFAASTAEKLERKSGPLGVIKVKLKPMKVADLVQTLYCYCMRLHVILVPQLASICRGR